jgi:hypothetical protein
MGSGWLISMSATLLAKRSRSNGRIDAPAEPPLHPTNTFNLAGYFSDSPVSCAAIAYTRITGAEICQSCMSVAGRCPSLQWLAIANRLGPAASDSCAGAPPHNNGAPQESYHRTLHQRAMSQTIRLNRLVCAGNARRRMSRRMSARSSLGLTSSAIYLKAGRTDTGLGQDDHGATDCCGH